MSVIVRHSLFKTLSYFLLLAAIFWGVEVIGPGRVDLSGVQGGSDTAGLPFGRWIDGVLGILPVLSVILSYLLVFVNSFYTTRVVVRNVIYLERTYMPAIIFLLISSAYYNSLISFRPLLAVFLLIMATEMIFRSYNYKSLAAGAYLIIGFLLGLAGAIYIPALFLVLLLPVALSLFRLFDPREWIAALVGWFMPLFFSAYAVWLNGGEFLSVIEDIRVGLLTPGEIPDIRQVNVFEWVFAGSAVILLLLSIVTFLRRRREYKRKPFKAFSFFIWMFAIWMAVVVCMPGRSLFQLPILALPLAVIIPTCFSSRKANYIPNALYLIMIVSAIVINLLPLLDEVF